MAESQTPVDLLAAIDKRRKLASTKAQDASLNELADMYTSRELIIRPDYQRLFRWPAEKQSQFIESLILEMPIPPLFVIEVQEGKWELIDGLQRVSSYLHFRGLLDAPDAPDPIKSGNMLELTGCDIVPELDGHTFDTLPSALQIRLKRSFLRVEIVRRESDVRFRYYMFKRLNTGGEQLSDQEVRNCTVRLLGTEFNDLLIKLSRDTPDNNDFRNCISEITVTALSQRVDQELALRFFAFKNNFDEFVHDIGPFLTNYMERVTDRSIPFEYAQEEAAFRKVFALLNTTLGEKTCQAWRGSGYRGGFSTHHFEAFSLGVARHVDRINLTNTDQISGIRSALENVKKDTTFQGLTTGGGKNSKGLYESKIKAVADAVEAVL